jgi:putative acetyltransferase
VEIQIRHVRDDDADAVHRILEAAHVTRGTMRLPYHSRETVKERIRHVDGVIKLVALGEGKVAGYAELVTHAELRHRHAGEVNIIATHPDFRGRQVGRALMGSIIDLADNWLQLTRLGLTVWTSNASAIALYRQFNFAVEGTMARYVFLGGQYVDAHVMGRVRPA